MDFLSSKTHIVQCVFQILCHHIVRLWCFTRFITFNTFTNLVLLAPQVVGRDGSEISANARDEVMAIGKEAFVQVGKVFDFV